jgi:arsenate reductase-like glutaredoxin family protein
VIKLYQAEWCPFSRRIRARLTELGIDYDAVNVSASAEKRTELEEITCKLRDSIGTLGRARSSATFSVRTQTFHLLRVGDAGIEPATSAV